jgi:hypothetical protein
MIFTAIFNLLYLSLNFLLTPIRNSADVPQSNTVTNAVSTASGYISSLNTYLPMSTLIAILGLVLLIEGFYLGHRLVNWAIRKIPTIS